MRPPRSIYSHRPKQPRGKPQIDKGRGCFGGFMRPRKSTVLPLLQGWMLIVRREGSENQEV